MSHELLKKVERFTFPLEIDSKKANPISVKLDFNLKDGTFAITPKITSKQVSDVSEDEREVMRSVLNNALDEAIERALQMRREWAQAQRDPNQRELFGEGDEEEEEEEEQGDQPAPAGE